jgi:hypothetical protein
MYATLRHKSGFYLKSDIPNLPSSGRVDKALCRRPGEPDSMPLVEMLAVLEQKYGWVLHHVSVCMEYELFVFKRTSLSLSKDLDELFVRLDELERGCYGSTAASK